MKTSLRTPSRRLSFCALVWALSLAITALVGCDSGVEVDSRLYSCSEDSDCGADRVCSDGVCRADDGLDAGSDANDAERPDAADDANDADHPDADASNAETEPDASDTSDSGDADCEPQSCEDFPNQCGILENGCGEDLACTCPDECGDQPCSCIDGECLPVESSDLAEGDACDPENDNCGEDLQCFNHGDDSTCFRSCDTASECGDEAECVPTAFSSGTFDVCMQSCFQDTQCPSGMCCTDGACDRC